jgi:hypothetical protein
VPAELKGSWINTFQHSHASMYEEKVIAHPTIQHHGKNCITCLRFPNVQG